MVLIWTIGFWKLTSWSTKGRETTENARVDEHGENIFWNIWQAAGNTVKWVTGKVFHLKIIAEQVSNYGCHRVSWLGQSKTEFFQCVRTTTIISLYFHSTVIHWTASMCQVYSKGWAEQWTEETQTYWANKQRGWAKHVALKMINVLESRERRQ